jgi:hypothetical protein
MICFPLDNTEYEANALGAWCGTRTRGVFAADNHYTVTANSDMTVTLGPGLAWLKADTYWGVNMFEINSTILTIDTADGSLTRYAAICLQLDKNLNTAGVVVKYGPYGTNPAISTLPPPEQNSLDYDEIYVAAIRIRAGTTVILSSDITDLRMNETYCGVMRDGVTGLPTQALYNAWWAWFEDLKMDAEQKAAAFAAWLANFKATSNVSFNSWYRVFTSDSETLFNDWFQNLQNQLDDNQAANLQNQITQHANTLAASDGGVHGIRYQDGGLQIKLAGGWVTVARVVLGLRSIYIDALGMTSGAIDALQYTSNQIDTLVEKEA